VAILLDCGVIFSGGQVATFTIHLSNGKELILEADGFRSEQSSGSAVPLISKSNVVTFYNTNGGVFAWFDSESITAVVELDYPNS
jgi:hypothetical protein